MTSDGQRPDTDDYDLLTFGEVAARLAEELAAQTAELEALRRQRASDPEQIHRLEQRIDRLKEGAARYRQEQHTSSVFARRFGAVLSAPPESQSDRPPWR